MQPYSISHLDPTYPELLRQIPNPPSLLRVRGRLPSEPRVYVAIVGTRHPDNYGVTKTHTFASELASAGIVIVSGLAYGLDAVAHQAALDAGGTTIAVLGSGVDTITPRAHQRLGEDILNHGGAIVSEQEDGTPARASFIVARNRLISGLCHATLVTQAAANSGTLHTAHFAINQNRNVFALPANVGAPTSAGSNDLLRLNRAQVVVSPMDIIDALKPELDLIKPLHKTEKRALTGTPNEISVLRLMRRHITTTQGLIDASELSPGELAQTISLLEITGRITNLGAGHWQIKQRQKK